jgi:hypothetical protein
MMKIEVWKAYDGKRAKRPIKEGIYKDTDGRLFGLARYLIDNGNAREIIEPEQPKKQQRKPRSDKGKSKPRTREVGK